MSLFKRTSSDETSYLAFHSPLLRLQETMPNPLGRKVLRALCLLLGFLIIWALIGRLDIVAVAEGKLVPQSHLKIIQPTESGIVREILIREGDAVSSGQVLMRMDMLIADADAKALDLDYHRKRLALLRIDAELAGKDFVSADIDAPTIAREAEAQFKANREALVSALEEERSRLSKAREELAAAEQMKHKYEETLPHYRGQVEAYEKLKSHGLVGRLQASEKQRELIEKEQELATQLHIIESARSTVVQSQRKLAQLESDYRKQLFTERQETQGAFDRLSEERAKLAHRRSLMELRAPQDGVVKELATHTIGTVVQPGTVLATLVPKNEALKAEVWVKNEDIGFVRPGQPVKLKLATYTFQKYGMATGIVDRVSADASDESGGNGALSSNAPPSEQMKPAVYKVSVALDNQHLEMSGLRFALGAGMQVMAEIRLGRRTVAEYLLSPVQQAWHEAGRER